MLSMLFMSKQYDHELVTEDYYAKELAYQEKIDAGKNLADAEFEVNLKVVAEAINLSFDGLPENVRPTGNVVLYKPNDQSLDETHPIHLIEEGNSMSINAAGKSGRYRVLVSFEIDGEPFYKEKELVL